MGYFDDFKLKTEGQLDELKGEINKQRGKGLKGGMQKLKGKVKKAGADLNMKTKAEDREDYM